MEMLIAAALTAILFTSIILWELPMALAPAALCFSMPRRMILPSILIASGVGLILGMQMGDAQILILDTTDCSIPVAAGSALTTVLVARRFFGHSAVLPSVAAAIVGCQFYNGVTDSSLPWVLLQVVVSMVFAAIIGMLIFRFVNKILANLSTHLLLKLSTLGSLMSISVLMMLVATGMNLSNLLMIASEGETGTTALTTIQIALAILLLAVLAPALKRKVSALSDDVFDADAAVSLSCVMATTITIFLFARGTMISPAVVTLCALAGARNIRSADILTSILLSPVISFLLAYTVSAVIGSVSRNQSMVMAEAIAGLLSMVCLVLVTVIFNLKRRPLPERTAAGDVDETFRRLNELQVHSMQIENEHLQNLLEIRRRDAISIAERISEQSSFIDDLFSMITEAEMTSDVGRKDELLHQVKSSLSLRRNFQDDRTDFYSKVETLHQDFSARLTEKCPQLSAQERKLATLLRLEFSSKYIGALLNISPKSVEVERHRLRKKLGLTREQNLIDYIKNI